MSNVHVSIRPRVGCSDLTPCERAFICVAIVWLPLGSLIGVLFFANESITLGIIFFVGSMLTLIPVCVCLAYISKRAQDRIILKNPQPSVVVTPAGIVVTGQQTGQGQVLPVGPPQVGGEQRYIYPTAQFPTPVFTQNSMANFPGGAPGAGGAYQTYPAGGGYQTFPGFAPPSNFNQMVPSSPASSAQNQAHYPQQPSAKLNSDNPPPYPGY